MLSSDVIDLAKSIENFVAKISNPRCAQYLSLFRQLQSFHFPVCTEIITTFQKVLLTMPSPKRAFTFQEKLALIWYIVDANTHLTIELGYVWLALTTTAQKTDSYLGWIWREYGRADARWAVRDANVISIEILTVLMGILCLFQIYGVYYRASWRHPLQIVICVSELYGGWMTFAPGRKR